MIAIRNRKGYDLNLGGAPSSDCLRPPPPPTVAVLPERLPAFKPRLKVQPGTAVKRGSLLCESKSDPRLKILSPGGGQVTDVIYGPRRSLREIVIRLDADEQAEHFAAAGEAALAQMPREDLVSRLLAGGVWPFIRALPFRRIADPDGQPPMILVALNAHDPFLPAPAVYLANRLDLFAFGLKVLQRLAPHVLVFTDPRQEALCRRLGPSLSHTLAGRYPAGDPGVLLYHIRRGPADNRAWYVAGQDLLLIAELVRDGVFPSARVYAVGGSGATAGCHVASRLGAPLRHLTQGRVDCDEPRFLLDGVLRGYEGHPLGHVGLYETGVTIVAEPGESPLLSLFRPGLNRPTRSRLFASALRRRPLAMDTNLNGGRRACIACGYCAEVCPVDIWPQMTHKSILAEEMEESLAHGLLDCVECGLCSYVCPSKIELAETLRTARAAYAREQA
jgi:Na+-transporting NADH:ubiquinone oxidoreductase subunit A